MEIDRRARSLVISDLRSVVVCGCCCSGGVEVSGVCVLTRSGRLQGFAVRVPAVSARGLPAVARRSRSVGVFLQFEPASDPNPFLLCAGRKGIGKCVGS